MPTRDPFRPIVREAVVGPEDVLRKQLAPPVPPGAQDRLVPGVLTGTTFQYTNTHPVLHCRIACVKSGTTASTVTITVDGNPMAVIGKNEYLSANTGFVSAHYLTGLASGTHTIAITVTGGVLGNAAIRMGELVSQSGIGGVEENVAGNAYYWEMDFGGPGAPTSIHGSVLSSPNVGAYDIYPSLPWDDEQWSTTQPGMAARFAYGGMNGEGGGFFVYYTRSGASYANAGLVYEILNGVLP